MTVVELEDVVEKLLKDDLDGQQIPNVRVTFKHEQTPVE
jgi:hypothetical protein